MARLAMRIHESSRLALASALNIRRWTSSLQAGSHWFGVDDIASGSECRWTYMA
jgi:hypothetical protein